MVFPENQHCHRSPLRGTIGIAADLVAPQYNARLEDRAYHRDPCSELAGLSINHGIHSDDKGVLQAAELDVAMGR